MTWKRWAGMAVGAAVALCVAALPAGASLSATNAVTDPASLLSGLGAGERIADIDPTLVRTAGPEADSSIVVASPGARASVSISLGTSQHLVALRDGYSVFDTPGRAASTFVAANALGGQVVFAAKAPQQLDDLSVTFDEGIRSWERINGDLLLTLGDGREIAVFEPWAHDARGQKLETSYQVAGSTLTQRVEVGADTYFPVVADPAWSYSKSYSVGNTTSSQAKSKLHSCFNCYFPVSGAPSRFPTPGTNLPLDVANLNFHCKFDEEFSGSDQGGSYWGFTFNAKSDHVDGAGSHISFTFRSGRSAPNLAVYAYIKNTHPAGLPQDVYVNRASAKWKDFADNMR